MIGTKLKQDGKSAVVIGSELDAVGSTANLTTIDLTKIQTGFTEFSADKKAGQLKIFDYSNDKDNGLFWGTNQSFKPNTFVIGKNKDKVSMTIKASICGQIGNYK